MNSIKVDAQILPLEVPQTIRAKLGEGITEVPLHQLSAKDGKAIAKQFQTDLLKAIEDARAAKKASAKGEDPVDPPQAADSEQEAATAGDAQDSKEDAA
jgi:hypothetical protein